MPSLSDLSASVSHIPQSAEVGSVAFTITGTTNPPNPTISGSYDNDVFVGFNAPFTPTLGGIGGDKALSYTPNATPIPGRTPAGTAVTGAFTTAGTYTSSIRVTDQNGKFADLAYNVVVRAVTPAPSIEDNFDLPGSLADRPNWTLVPDGENMDPENGWVAVNGSLKNTNLYSTGRGWETFSPNGGFDDNSAWRFDYNIVGDPVDGYPTNNTYQDFAIWFEDANNYCMVTMTTLSYRVNIRMRAVVNGDVKIDMNWPIASSPNDIPSQGYFEVYTLNSKAKVKFNDRGLFAVELKYPQNRIDFATGFPFGTFPYQYTPDQRGARMGVTSNTWTYPLLDAIGAKKNKVMVIEHDAAVGRDTLTSPVCTFTIKAEFVDDPVQWVYRLRASENNAPIGGLTRITPTTIADGIATLRVPLGVRSKAYIVEVGFIEADGYLYLDETLWCQASSFAAMVDGQSNAEQLQEPDYANERVLAPGAAVAAYPSQTQHANYTDGNNDLIPNGLWWNASTQMAYRQMPTVATMAETLVALSGQSVMAYAAGQGGQGLQNFLQAFTVSHSGVAYQTNHYTSADDWWQKYRTISYYSMKGARYGTLWDQGEDNADANYDADTGTQYLEGVYPNYHRCFIDGYYPQLCGDLGNPKLTIGISTVGRWASADLPINNQQAADAQIHDRRRHKVHLEHKKIIDEAPWAYWSAEWLGCHHGDEYHYSPEGRKEKSRRLAYSYWKNMMSLKDTDGDWLKDDDGNYIFPPKEGQTRETMVDGMGPEPISAQLTHGRQWVEILIDLNGAAALTDFVEVETGPVSTLGPANSYKGYNVFISNGEDYMTADMFNLLEVASHAVEQVDATHAKLTLKLTAPVAAGNTVKVMSYMGGYYDDTWMVWGHTYADGRADLPTRRIIDPLIALEA